jgi:hypothetical protein
MKQLIGCDFSTNNQRGFTWFDNSIPTAVVTLYKDGTAEFTGVKYRVHIENIGTDEEKVIVVERGED